MDLRNLLGKLDQINEGTMSSAKKKPTGPKFVGKMKGTDPASAAKDKYVGGSMEESIFKELEESLQKQPARDLKREFAEFKRISETTNNKFNSMMAKVTSKKSLHAREALGLMDELIHQGGATYKEALHQASVSFEIDPDKLHELYQQQSSSLDEGTSLSVEELAKHLETAQTVLTSANQFGKEIKYTFNDIESSLHRLQESVSASGLGDFATDIVYAVQEAQEKLSETLSAIYGISEQAKSVLRELQWRIDDAEVNGITETQRNFSDIELAVMEGGHELISENPVPPAPAPGQQAAQPGKPTLGADIGKPQAQQQQQQQAADQVKQQQDAAKKEIQQQQNIQKGVNNLKQAGAAVSNPSQTVAAFDKVADNAALTPNDKNNIASAGTVLGPIMGNQQLAGKFKDLVSQAGAAQQKQAQQQQKQAQQAPQVQQPQAPGATK